MGMLLVQGMGARRRLRLIAVVLALAAHPSLRSFVPSRRAAQPTRATARRATACTTDEGQALELQLDKVLASQDLPGEYVITAATAIVGPTAELTPPPHLASLERGSTVEVLEVQRMEAAQRVRGRVASGWISLRHLQTGFRWAERTEAWADFDADLAQACRQFGEGSSSDGLEAELWDEVSERRKGDLLYLTALRGLTRAGLPLLAAFEGRWVFSGSGVERWREIAGSSAQDVRVESVTEPLRRELRRGVLGGAEYTGELLDTYTSRRSDGPFADFLVRFVDAKNKVLVSVGGSGGLPSHVSPAFTPPEEKKWSLTEEEEQEWWRLFAAVSSCTRVQHGDTYFGHILFGICLRRLSRRVDLARSVSDMPVAVQFEAFAEDCDLEAVLALSDSTLSAARRRIEVLFGKGLRDEIAKSMDRVAEQCKEQPETPPMEILVSLMLESAQSGELRMLSAGPEVKARLLWDAVVFGAFLEEAETALMTLEAS